MIGFKQFNLHTYYYNTINTTILYIYIYVPIYYRTANLKWMFRELFSYYIDKIAKNIK